MKIGIVGFAGSGKTAVFQWLTGVKPDVAAAQRGQVGIAKVPDDRLDWLSAQFRPKKTTAATLELMDTPGLLATERADNPRRLGIQREADGLLVVLNGFDRANDLAAELRKFREELFFADLEIISNRIDRLKDQLKKPRPAKEREANEIELALLQRIATAFEQGQSSATLGLRDDEEKSIRSFQLLTLKSECVLVNIDDNRLSQPLPADLLALAPNAKAVPAKLELELEDLAPEDRQVFMQELGVQGSVRNETLRWIYYGTGQVVFFTIGEDECRAWNLAAGSDAVTGAGKIHTDLAKRFVRAEVVSYDDYRRVGSMKEAKSQGVYRLEGKTYIVKDGDIMHIL